MFGLISKTEQDFEILKSLEFEISPDLTHKNQRKLLNFQDTGLIILPWLSTYGHNFQGRHTGGILPNLLHEILPNSRKLVPCQLQLANEHSLTRQEFTCLASSGHLVEKIWEVPVPKFSPFISYTIC